jgi:hypothetical protein
LVRPLFFRQPNNETTDDFDKPDMTKPVTAESIVVGRSDGNALNGRTQLLRAPYLPIYPRKYAIVVSDVRD